MSIRFLTLVLACLISACRAMPQKHNLNRASTSMSPEDPRTSAERRVLIFATYWRQDEQEELIDRGRDHYFISVARDALDRNVRGSACRWLISHAKVLRERIKIEPDTGVEPDEMTSLNQIASRDAQVVCLRPTRTN